MKNNIKELSESVIAFAIGVCVWFKTLEEVLYYENLK